MPKVFLSAGHGGSDPGAVGNGLQEKNINLQIMLSCKAVLEYHGIEVVCSRTKDENDPVRDEVKEANACKADLAFSIHINAGGGDGSEAFYYPGDTNGLKLAMLCENQVRALGQNSRGVKNGKHLYFINSTNMTAVLVEGAFIDNKNDIVAVDEIAEQKNFGIAYAKAILEYFGIEYKGEAKEEASDVRYRVQVGSFASKANAEKLANELKSKGYSVFIVQSS